VLEIEAALGYIFAPLDLGFLEGFGDVVKVAIVQKMF